MPRTYTGATCCAATTYADEQLVAGNKQHVAGNKLRSSGRHELSTVSSTQSLIDFVLFCSIMFLFSYIRLIYALCFFSTL